MLTEAMTAVDGDRSRAAEPPRAVMWSISQIAGRDRISKQAVSKKVGALTPLGLTVERDAHGRVAAVNVVEYDRLRGRTDDPSKAQAGGRAAPPSQPAGENESYNEAIRQKTWHEAEKRRLELAELKAELVPVARVTDAVIACGADIAKICDRLPGVADELVAAYERGGAHALRLALKQLAFRQRNEIADALAAIATGAPKQEPEPETTEPLPL